MSIVKKISGIAREAIKAVHRSSGWNALRKQHLLAHPKCEACGSKKMLQVHHVQPFKENPALELDPGNLITLCLFKDCHVDIGHGGSYKCYCPDVREICASIKKKSYSLEQGKELAKQGRKLNDGDART